MKKKQGINLYISRDKLAIYAFSLVNNVSTNTFTYYTYIYIYIYMYIYLLIYIYTCTYALFFYFILRIITSCHFAQRLVIHLTIYESSKEHVPSGSINYAYVHAL